MKKVIIYTQMELVQAIQVRGRGAVLMYDNNKKEISGYNKSTTNNI